MFPALQVGSATIQVLAPAALTEVECILPEETMAISDLVARAPGATPTCTHNNPSVSSVRTMVPEPHASMTTSLKHLKPHKTPPSTKLSPGRSAAPAVQAIIVNCVSIVKPQLASIVRVDLEVVTACPEDPQTTCPTHSEVIASAKTGPFATSVAIVHHVFPASHVRSTGFQVLAPAALPKVEDVLPEKTRAISDGIAGLTSATCTHNKPSVPSVSTSVPEQHPSMTTALKHFEFHMMPPGALMLVGLPIAPTVQAIVIDGVPIVDPQLAAII